MNSRPNSKLPHYINQDPIERYSYQFMKKSHATVPLTEILVTVILHFIHLESRPLLLCILMTKIQTNDAKI